MLRHGIALLTSLLAVVGCSADVARPDGEGGAAGGTAEPAERDGCSPFIERPVKTDVVIRFVNDTDRVLWEGHALGACETWFPVEVAGGDVKLVHGPTCNTCQGRSEGECGCFFGCITFLPRALGPGETIEHIWPGIVIRPGVQQPEECDEFCGGGHVCDREEAPGPLTLRGTLHSEKIDESKVGGERFDVDVSWTPGQTLVEIVFD